MIYVSEVLQSPPTEYKSQLQEKVYQMFSDLAVPFERVECDEIHTMEECLPIDEKLHMQTVKTLFLCNRQKTNFYLFVTRGDQPFSTKDFSHALSISRVSMGPADLMIQMLDTQPGSATIFSCLLESAKDVTLVLDHEAIETESYGCTDGTLTCYMKIKTADLMGKIIPYMGKEPIIL